MSAIQMKRTRVKICGITRIEDAETAIAYGADAIGLMFYPQSPRAISLEKAQAITAIIPAFVSVVGLFVNPEPTWVSSVLNAMRIDCLQFHGDETPEQCRAYQKPYIKVIRMKSETNVLSYTKSYADAGALLLDAYQKDKFGGTGQTFDWQAVPKDLTQAMILAGGLRADNVKQAIQQAQPFAVDVSGGVEQQHGIKDPNKIAQFMRAVSQSCKW